MFEFDKTIAFHREKFVPISEATVSIANSGFLYGLGVFTGMRANYNKSDGKLYLFRPYDHHKRLMNSAKLMRYANFLRDYADPEKFVSVLKELLTKNQITSDAYLRITIFSDENKVTPKLLYADSWSAYIYPLGDYVSTTGMRCITSSWTRVADNSIPARAKINGCYVNSAFAKTEALLAGMDEAIFLDSDGHAVEGSAENLFVVQGSKVITPPKYNSILEGITRDSILTILADLGYVVEERPIDRSELYYSDEVILSGTGAKVCPVVEIDHRVVGQGSIGKVGAALKAAYDDAIRGVTPKYSSWLVSV